MIAGLISVWKIYGMGCDVVAGGEDGRVGCGNGSVLGFYGVGLVMFVMCSVRTLVVFVIYMRRVMWLLWCWCVWFWSSDCCSLRGA